MDKPASAVLLAGGFSSRMGRCKAGLDFHGVSFLQHQINKLRSLGIEDIVVAGSVDAPAGCRSVPDIYPHRGPLSGIHAGLLTIKEDAALVLAVDTPLVPLELLRELIDTHTAGITLVTCSDEPEPLIGVYDKSLAGVCEEALRSGKVSVRRFCQEISYASLVYEGEAALLTNCNTPEDYIMLPELKTRESKNG